MNELAEILNNTLQGTIAARLLSEYGTRLFFPKGIVAQTAEALSQGVRINATQGIATDGSVPFMLPSLQALYQGHAAKHVVPYAPTGGIPELRSTWKRQLLLKNKNLSPYHMSEPVVVPGITSGISLAADLLIDQHDAVVIATPMWGNYQLIVNTRYQAHIVTYPLFSSAGGYNVEGLGGVVDALVGEGKRKIVLVFNFPHNPTGYSLGTAEAEELLQCLYDYAQKGIALAVILDDAYFGLWYEDSCYRQSLFAPLSQLHPNIMAIKVDGATKEEYAWGLRVGFVTFGSAELTPDHYNALEQKSQGAIRAAFSNSNRWAQYSLLQSIESTSHHREKENYFLNLKERYVLVKDCVATRTSTRLTPLPFNSGYFVAFKYNGDAEALRKTLLAQKIGIIAIGSHYIRVTYSTLPPNQISDFFNTLLHYADS